ncbi:MAG: hypothetical protein NC092_10300, partial [Butyrivibrio sp.]|nr:hypothetical protein [Butyrivibrio sp.]
MKVIKGISLFFIYPAAMLCLGFWGGVEASHYFYPGGSVMQETQVIEGVDFQGDVQRAAVEKAQNPMDAQETPELSDAVEEDGVNQQEALPASSGAEKLSALTEYVLLETDILRNTEVE